MNKVFTILGLSIASILLMANSSGRGSVAGEAVTGAPGEAGNTCGKVGCHTAGAFDVDGMIEFLDSDGNVVDNYEIDEEYTVRLNISNSGNPSAYGFQMVALGDTEENAGEWLTLPDPVVELTMLNRSYVEQGAPYTSPTVEIPWTASEDVGDVTFYYSVNAVNGNGSPSGDGVASGSFTASFAGSSSVNELKEAELLVYPNPSVDRLTIENIKTNRVRVFDARGKCISHQYLGINSSIEVGHLQPGLYYLQADDSQQMAKFVKI